MNLDDIKHSIRTFFKGEETEKGQNLIERWYHSFDDKPNQLADYSEEEQVNLRRKMWHNIDRATGRSPKVTKLFSHRNQRNYSAWPFKIASGFVAVLIIVSAVFYFQNTSSNSAESDYQSFSAPAGQAAQIVLVDGSKVWLSPSSTIQYPTEFQDDFRIVELEGEAFFDIKQNLDKPFVVKSNRLQVRVLGTSFNIRNYNNEINTEITVATGHVAVEKRSTPEESSTPIAELLPDQQFVFNKDSESGKTKSVNSKLYSSWKDGEIVFQGNTFEDITRYLERWYGVSIFFEDESLKEIRFKITLQNSSLSQALKKMQLIENFNFRIENNHVWIEP